MMKKSMLLILSSVFALSVQSLAVAATPPAKCPSVAAIISGGIEFIHIDPLRHNYVGMTLSQYDTNDKWGFAIGDFKASSPAEAVALANASLQSVSGSPVPQKVDEDFWMCEYAKGTADFAVAFSPIDDSQLKNISKYLNKH